MPVTGSIRFDHAHLVDPSNNLEGIGYVLVQGGKVVEISPGPIDTPADRVVDATGLIITPGWIDMHVHLRVPGQEHKETMQSGTRAAAAGGFTAIACMPNTTPALDSVEVITDLLHLADTDGVIPVLPIAAITKGRAGGGNGRFRCARQARRGWLLRRWYFDGKQQTDDGRASGQCPFGETDHGALRGSNPCRRSDA